MANKKIFEVIGAAALIGAIYKIGVLKGSLETGIRFAKNPEKCEQVKEVIDEGKKGLDAIKEGKKVSVKMTKDDFKVEVTEPAEEAEEIVSEDETEDQPED